jgi:RNA polymerase sigma-70 factor (ECF subfamily)
VTTPDEDRALVARANDGDRRALDTLLRTHYDRIYAVCRRITGSDADAADAAQEALIKIVRSLPGFDGRSAFSTWAYRIATNTSLDELRRRRRRPAVVDRVDDDGRDIELVDPDAGPRVEAVADRMAIDAALAQVPETFRVPLVLRDVGDLDYAEIADALDVPVGTVKSRIARGRAALVELLAAGNRGPADERPTPDL